MRRLYIIGGQQKKDARKLPEWSMWDRAVVVELDLETGQVEKRVEYVSPPEACAADDNPSVLFKAGTLEGDCLYVCTQTEVLTYALPSFERVGYVSLPCFNDVHHVRPTAQGTLLVANTGLDSVVEVTTDGEMLREWSVLGENTWDRFSKDIDYRKVLTTKPHRSHPNHVFELDGEYWVTRLLQKDAICLTATHAPIPISPHPVHDGLVRNGQLSFTAVSGRVIQFNAETKTLLRDVELDTIIDSEMPLGWCRGLEVVDEDRVIVGFSRLRPTKYRQNLNWLKRQLGGGGWGLQPTRAALFDLRRKRLCDQWDLERGGLNTIFSIHAVAGSTAHGVTERAGRTSSLATPT